MGFKINKNFHILLKFLILSVFLTACSQTVNTQNAQSNDKNNSAINYLNHNDSLERYNRSIYAFNVGLDNYLVKPVAKVYKGLTPGFIGTSINNFFQNLDDIGSSLNNLLQFKVGDAVNDAERFVVNSTLGFAGLLDVASEAGLEKHDEDFGQTLARWGVGSGPYIMLPFLGPSTIRDASARFSIDRLTDPTRYTNENPYYFLIKGVNQRAGLLAQEDAFRDVSDDKYSAIRDAWLQRREYLIRDGAEDEKSDVDLIDELESLDLE